MPQVVIAITSGTLWRVPADCTSATIECIGGGGGGGGAYSKTNLVTGLTPLSLAYINIGVNGGDTWFNKSSNAAPSTTTNGALAKGGQISSVCCSSTIPGGQASGGVGDTKFSGGDGQANLTCGAAVYEIGGGAAGPSGPGGNAGDTAWTYYGGGGGGGGANGGTSGANGASPPFPFGGTGNGGTGGNAGGGGGSGGAGGLGSTSSGTVGSPGTNGGGGGGGGADTSSPYVAVNDGGGAGSMQAVWTDYLGNSYGPAGGSGGEPGSNINLTRTVTRRTNYGGGGAISGGQGLIIVTYTPVVTIGNSYTEVLNTNGPTDVSTPSRWRIPYGVETVTIHAIGSGGIGQAYSPYGGGGGGAYASSTIDVSTLNNTGAYYLNYFSAMGYGSGSSSWFNRSSSSAPSSATDGVFAKGAEPATRTGGLASASVGTTRYDGGNGGTGGGTTIPKTGGGGGAAGPSGAGKNGGNVFSSANSSGSSGGGGGANGGSSTAGGNSTSATVAGAGGAGNGGSGGGSAGTASVNAGNGTNGGGGGGGKNTTGRSSGGNGGMQAIWTDSGSGTQFGPSGGGGGAAGLTSSNYGFPGVPSFGGGGGYYALYPEFSPSGPPLLVLQYTITKAAPGSASTGNMFLMF